MNYSTLEGVYGTPFGQRVPVTHQRKDVKSTPIQPPPSTAAAAVQSIVDSLPLDTAPVTENFRPPPPRRIAVQEKFTQPASVLGGEDDKLSRILRLIEQNRTGYERPATQDMVLYIATGVFFLFTFDTFVMLGKSMRGR
jgi:hypothetical protein